MKYPLSSKNDAALREAGGATCTYGPCMAYVWWVFHQADLDIFLSDGQLLSGWPHDQFDWYSARGRVDRTPRPGDVVFFRFDGFDEPSFRIMCCHGFSSTWQ